MRFFLFIILISIYMCKVFSASERLHEDFFEYKKAWENESHSKLKKHRICIDKVCFEFMLPDDMGRTKYAKLKYSGEHIESVFSFESNIDKYDQFFLLKSLWNENDTILIKNSIKIEFYNSYCSQSGDNSPFIITKGYMGKHPYYTDLYNGVKRNWSQIKEDTVRTLCTKTFAINGELYSFIYDTDDHVYEVPLEEKLAVMKSIRIISKEEAKAEEEKNTAGNIKFLISMLALLFLVFIGSKLNNRR